MSLDTEALYRLLPAVYRLRDAGEGEPLRELIGVIARELGVLEENLEQLYDDQFIETCADWAAPYIGQLVGYRPLHGVAARVSSPRADVANTIRNRRRKGTASMLERLARDVTEWPAYAVEYFEQLCATQYMKHLRPHALATANFSQREMLGLGGPFNKLSHTAEMRRPETRAGRFNIPNVGIWIWRLAPFRLTNVPLIADPGDAGGRRFRLNPLGLDLALFRDVPEAQDVPVPLTVREFALQVRDAVATAARVTSSRDYGAGRSVVITRGDGDLPLRLASALPPVDDADVALIVRIADLRDIVDGGGTVTGWAHEDDIAAHQIGIDPERGRVLLGADLAAEHAAHPFIATFHYGFARAMGGGEYERVPTTNEDVAADLEAEAAESLQPHLDELEATGGRLLIRDSLTYTAPAIRLDGVTTPDASGLTLIVGARNGARPLICATADITLDIGARGTLVLDGLVIAGGTLQLPDAGDNEPRTLILRDCTLVPGADPSLVVGHPFTRVQLERCITGPLHVVAEANVGVELTDCIVDAGAPANVAFAANPDGDAGARITLQQCTIIGAVDARVIELASNCIFLGTVRASRRQEGCLRFCWLPADSVTPRRFRCLPDAAHPHAQPHFTALRYSHPGYCQLRSVTPREIREGADDGGEMGVMHALFQPQRETNLRIRLDEYLRFGSRAGFFYAT
jgi:hypothetical protein